MINMRRLYILLIAASAVLVSSCKSEKAETLRFADVYADFMSIIDNPDSVVGKSMASCHLPKVYQDTVRADSVNSIKKAVLIFASGAKADLSHYGERYNSKDVDEHAVGVRIESYFDPEVYVDFRDKQDADKFYEDIEDYGVIEDMRGNRFVTEKKIGPGITQVNDDEINKYARTICVNRPRQIMKGWYTIVFMN